MSNVRLCHLTTVHPPDDVRIYQKEARSLAQAGYDVTLVAPALKEVRLEGVRWLALRPPKGRFDRFLRLGVDAYRNVLASRAKVVHIHDPELIFVGLALKLSGRKVIWDVHEDLPLQVLSKPWIPEYLRRLASWLTKGSQQVAALVFDAVVAATPAIAKHFPSRKTVTIHNFPRLEELEGRVTPYRDRPLQVLYAGGITSIRGTREMVEAIGRVKSSVELILAGSFESEDLKQQLSRMPGWSRTRFLGWVDRVELAKLLGQARVGLVLFAPVPNHIEALPNKIFEYMASATPFVASDFPIWREYGEGAGLFVDPKDPEAIADAIEWLINHPDEAEKMGRRGRELVEERYNWEAEARKLSKLYEEVLKK